MVDERKVKLTDRVVNATKPEGARFVIWDTAQPGFGLRVEPSGHKSFIVRYRANGGGRNAPRRQMTVNGTPGEVLTAEIARKIAKGILASVAHGGDPALERDEKRKEMTVSELCDLYLEEGLEAKKPSTIATDRGRILRHIKPLLGKRRISEVAVADVERFMRDVAHGKTAIDVKTKKRGRAIVEGGKGTSSRTLGLLGGIFSFAVKRKLRPDNPVRGVKRYADKKCERFLCSKEISALGEALRELESRNANAAAVAIIRLLTFTGARKSEIAGLQWSEVDIRHACLCLKDSKTGQKSIMLGPPALAILKEIKREGDAPFVFPAATGNGHFLGTEKVWRKARQLAKLPDVRIHDLRHSFASTALASGDSLALIGKLLGHADVKTTARYAHLADDPLKKAADRIAKDIAAAMDGAA